MSDVDGSLRAREGQGVTQVLTKEEVTNQKLTRSLRAREGQEVVTRNKVTSKKVTKAKVAPRARGSGQP